MHEHTFEPRDGGTLARDRVMYVVPLDWRLHSLFVRPDSERIFKCRAAALREWFAAPPRE